MKNIQSADDYFGRPHNTASENVTQSRDTEALLTTSSRCAERFILCITVGNRSPS